VVPFLGLDQQRFVDVIVFLIVGDTLRSTVASVLVKSLVFGIVAAVVQP
tara:strand:+ start:1184 stop:1330 length:147 start_codon:yes stop_codon:yes gene_type:complete